eukprot:TRINITY_DN1391_c1_g1_i1.p1 TRINITY_DN1391_c1_g1~~TRINITY_DN1391_c1_g1_i1.p1  ORF type:complete len:1165 (-),score=172.39 TRINITY_DN1391_c1_g1_i1:311-3805(-)
MKSACVPALTRTPATGIRSRVRRSSFGGSWKRASGAQLPLHQIKEAPGLSEECREDEEVSRDSPHGDEERDLCVMIAARYEAAAALAMQYSETHPLTDSDEVPGFWELASTSSSLTSSAASPFNQASSEPVVGSAERENLAGCSSDILFSGRKSNSGCITGDASAHAQSPDCKSNPVQGCCPTSPAADTNTPEPNAALRSASGSPQNSEEALASAEPYAPSPARVRSRERSASVPPPSVELPSPAALKEQPMPPREQAGGLVVAMATQEQPLSSATSRSARRTSRGSPQQTRNPKLHSQPLVNTEKEQVASPPRRLQRTPPPSLVMSGRHSAPRSPAAEDRSKERPASPSQRIRERPGLASSTSQLPCKPASVAKKEHSSPPATSKHGTPQQPKNPKRPSPPPTSIRQEQVASPPVAIQRTPPRSLNQRSRHAGICSSAAEQAAPLPAESSANVSQRQLLSSTQLHTLSEAARAPSPVRRSKNTASLSAAKLEELTSESQLLFWPSQLLQCPVQASSSSTPSDGSTLVAPLPPSTWTSREAGVPTSPGETQNGSVTCPASTADTAATATVEMNARTVGGDADAKITSAECSGKCGNKYLSTAKTTSTGAIRSRSLPRDDGVQRAVLKPLAAGLTRSASLLAPSVSCTAKEPVCHKTKDPVQTHVLAHQSNGLEGNVLSLLRGREQQFQRRQQESTPGVMQGEQALHFQTQPWPWVQTSRCHLPQAEFSAQASQFAHMQHRSPAGSTACGREPSNLSVKDGSRPTTPRLWEGSASHNPCTARSLSPGYGFTGGGELSSSTLSPTTQSDAALAVPNRNWLSSQGPASVLTPPSPTAFAPCGFHQTGVEDGSRVAAAAWEAAGQIIRRKQLRSDGSICVGGPQKCTSSSSPRSASSPEVSNSRVQSPGARMSGFFSDPLSGSACSQRVPSPDARLGRFGPDKTPRVLSPEARMGRFATDLFPFSASAPSVQQPHARLGGFVPDQLNPMDKAMEELLRHLDETTADRLAVRKLAPGQYSIDGRTVSLQWGRGGSISRLPNSTSDLLVFEQEAPGFIGDGIDLPIYISQAANVSASLRGADPGAAAVGRIPQELRLTFQDRGNIDSGGIDSVLPHIRRELMEKAVREASLRQHAAEHLERQLLSPRDCTGKLRRSTIPMYPSTQASLSL